MNEYIFFMTFCVACVSTWHSVFYYSITQLILINITLTFNPHLLLFLILMYHLIGWSLSSFFFQDILTVILLQHQPCLRTSANNSHASVAFINLVEYVVTGSSFLPSCLEIDTCLLVECENM